MGRPGRDAEAGAVAATARRRVTKLDCREKCPQHKLGLVALPRAPIARLRVCPFPGCTYVTLAAADNRTGRLFRGRNGPIEREKSVSAAIVQMLTLRGYEVLETAEHRRRILCGRPDKQGRLIDGTGCGRWIMPTGGRGVDYGIPDLFIRHYSRYPPFAQIGCEVKADDTPFQPEQTFLIARLGYFVAYSPEECWARLQLAEAYLLGDPGKWERDRLEIMRQLDELRPEGIPDRLDALKRQRDAFHRLAKAEIHRLDAEIERFEAER